MLPHSNRGIIICFSCSGVGFCCFGRSDGTGVATVGLGLVVDVGLSVAGLVVESSRGKVLRVSGSCLSIFGYIKRDDGVWSFLCGFLLLLGVQQALSGVLYHLCSIFATHSAFSVVHSINECHVVGFLQLLL